MSMFRGSAEVCRVLLRACHQSPAASSLQIASLHTASRPSSSSMLGVPAEAPCSFKSSFGMAVWTRVAALATKSNTAPFPVAVDIGSGKHAEMLAQLGMHVIGNPFTSQDPSAFSAAKKTPKASSVDLVLAASLARKDIVPRLMQAFSLLKNDGHLVACWNDRDLGHPTTKALLRARHATASATTMHSTPTSPHPSPMPQTPGNHAGAPVRGVSTHASPPEMAPEDSCQAACSYSAVCTHGGDASVAPFPQDWRSLMEEQHEYNATRHMLENVVGPDGRSLFRVVSFSIRPNPLPLPTPLPSFLSGLDPADVSGPLVMPFETKMFILRKAC